MRAAVQGSDALLAVFSRFTRVLVDGVRYDAEQCYGVIDYHVTCSDPGDKRDKRPLGRIGFSEEGGTWYAAPPQRLQAAWPIRYPLPTHEDAIRYLAEASR